MPPCFVGLKDVLNLNISACTVALCDIALHMHEHEQLQLLYEGNCSWLIH